MLETRNPPVSNRTRRLDAPPRPMPPRVSSAPAAARSRMAGSAAPAAPDPRPAPRPSSRPRMSRLARSEMRLLGVAIVCLSLVCGLLLLYLAAYAHVTRLGIDQSQASSRLHTGLQRNEMLRAERDRLQSPQRVAAAAAALGMSPRGETPVTYLAAPGGRGQDREAGQQGENGGTTADSRAAASFDH